MITVIYAHKAGQGVTTIAAALATITARAGKRTLLVDTGTDLAAVLGINEDHNRPTLTEYLTDTAVALAAIVTNVTENLDLITRGDRTEAFGPGDSGTLTGGLDDYDHVIIDTTPQAHAWTRHADARVLVTRPCYLALRHATGRPRPHHLVVITEPGRALDTGDVEAVTGTPVTAIVPYLPDIARAIDSGTLLTRPPRTLTRSLTPLVESITSEQATR